MATVTGGGKLLSALTTIGNKLKNTLGPKPELHVGFLHGAVYQNGTSVGMVAAIQEFGAPRAGIPPRPYFRTMIAAHKDEWPPALGRMLKANNYDARLSLTQLGQEIEGQLRASIVAMNVPALSPVTLMLRRMKRDNPALRLTMTYATVIEARRRVAAGMSYAGVSTKPLVESSHMLDSIDSEIVSK